MEIIQPEFEVDVKPEKEGTLVRIIDLTEGKIILKKHLNLKTREVIEKLREKLKEVF